MSKRIYISADYDIDSGDRNVVDLLNKWGSDDLHKVDFVDMAKVVSGSVSNNPDCRICDLKGEFNSQINASSAVIFVVGDKTASRTAGSSCRRNINPCNLCTCTPYKQNRSGEEKCVVPFTFLKNKEGDVPCVNHYSYLRHEFEQAKKRNKKIIILYNSTRNEHQWLPSYMRGYEGNAAPFWVYNILGNKVGNYAFIKKQLGYE